MKKLLLLFVLVFSTGAFAQTPVEPIDPNIPFGISIMNFIPECSLRFAVAGEYDLVAFGPKSWIGQFTYAEIEEMIQDYICMYNRFPDYVEVDNFRPILIQY